MIPLFFKKLFRRVINTRLLSECLSFILYPHSRISEERRWSGQREVKGCARTARTTPDVEKSSRSPAAVAAAMAVALLEMVLLAGCLAPVVDYGPRHLVRRMPGSRPFHIARWIEIDHSDAIEEGSLDVEVDVDLESREKDPARHVPRCEVNVRTSFRLSQELADLGAAREMHHGPPRLSIETPGAPFRDCFRGGDRDEARPDRGDPLIGVALCERQDAMEVPGESREAFLGTLAILLPDTEFDREVGKKSLFGLFF